MQRPLLMIIFFSVAGSLCAQRDSIKKVLADTVYSMEKVVATGFQTTKARQTSMNITPYSLEQMNERAPFNLSDALAKLPGVSQMTTGNAISKPVVRGLYGNRVLVLLSGIRFDNQQWQDEHGLGLSQIGINRVELVRGPASLLYGSDAVGGVINIIEEKPVKLGQYSDMGTQLYSNTLGGLLDAGVSEKSLKSWWRLRLGAENHGDYSDGKGQRVLNSRNRGYYLKSGFGFEKKNWTQENSYNFSYNEYGFVMEDLAASFGGDARWVRSMNGPHHIVLLNLLNSQNTFHLNGSELKLNIGYQSNIRMEDEGGGAISLNMHLSSYLQNLKWEKRIGRRTLFVLNQQFTLTTNTNYGGRIIIPDALMLESNLAGYLKYSGRKFIVECGAGANQKHIKTILTRTLNSPGQPIQPFTKDYLTPNAMLGFVWLPNNRLTIKQNNATGFRSPNLAELSSNGLHEGVYRYEIGDPGMKVEQSFNSDLNVLYSTRLFQFNASAYYNYMRNYIYLAPTAHDSFFHFPVYLFRQQDAAIKGTEVYASYRPAGGPVIIRQVFSSTIGTLSSGTNLPFIPACKSSTSVRLESQWRRISYFIEPEFVHVFAQDRPALFETSTPAYSLVNLNSGITLGDKSGKSLKIMLNITNATNTAYFDHLSRLKYFGLLNQGRNIVLSIRKQL